MTSYRAVLLFGCPGSGKGTQGKVLGALPGFVHLAMGDVFRALDDGSELGREVAARLAQGQLVDDDLTIRIFREHLEGMIRAGRYDPAGHLLVLDGIPRTLEQARALEPFLEVVRILHLCIEDQDALFTRLRSRALQQGRPDDADEAIIRRRYETYRRETAGTLAAYEERLLARIDASRTPVEVAGAIFRDLAEHVPATRDLDLS